MIKFSRLIPLNVTLGVVHGQEKSLYIAEPITARIPGDISQGKPVAPAPRPKPLVFKVKNSVTRQMQVEEAPEMAGLPPIKGKIKVTVQLVEDPGLVDPAPPLPAMPVTDPAVLARMAECRAKFQLPKIAFVSASVYEHKRTLISCHPNGKPSQVITAWSNLDFNHFSGFIRFEIKERKGIMQTYNLMMGISDMPGPAQVKRLAKAGQIDKAPRPPNLPDLAVAGPAFVVVEGDASDPEAMSLLQGMHDLYRSEGPRMKAAYHARMKAQAARRAYLLANPPKPEDVTIQFWERATPSAAGIQNLKEGPKP
jgi:hypothetical protein